MKIWVLLVLVCGATAVGSVSGGSQESGSVAKEVKKLYSGDDAARTEARRRLRSIAGRSPEMRSEVIKTLLGVLDDPNVTYRTWGDAAGLAGDLRATEAIDRLVERLDYNDGTVGLSAAHYPALRAVISIGGPAVPRLEKALAGARPSIRGKATQALGAIGGRRPRQALTRASATETNEEVKAYIQNALLKMNKQ